MRVEITFRHMEHTPALDQTIREKSEKFSKWFGANCEAHWTCWMEGKSFFSEIKVRSAHQEYFAKADADDLYKTFDLVVHKIQNQIK